MGARFRLRASFHLPASKCARPCQVVIRAMKTYGLILADNGSNWYVSGAPSQGWSNDQLHTLGRVRGSDFEVVDASSLRPR